AVDHLEPQEEAEHQQRQRHPRQRPVDGLARPRLPQQVDADAEHLPHPRASFSASVNTPSRSFSIGLSSNNLEPAERAWSSAAFNAAASSETKRQLPSSRTSVKPASVSPGAGAWKRSDQPCAPKVSAS